MIILIYVKYLLKFIFLFSFMLNISFPSHSKIICSSGKPDIKTTYPPDEFQAHVILNSFLKDRIIDDMTHWFTESHFPYGNSTAWHRIRLETSTLDLHNNGVEEKLVMVYYDSQNYCGVGGQCTTYLLREIDGEWKKIDSWHDVKFQDAEFSCETKSLSLTIGENSSFGIVPESKRLIIINLNDTYK